MTSLQEDFVAVAAAAVSSSDVIHLSCGATGDHLVKSWTSAPLMHR